MYKVISMHGVEKYCWRKFTATILSHEINRMGSDTEIWKFDILKWKWVHTDSYGQYIPTRGNDASKH